MSVSASDRQLQLYDLLPAVHQIRDQRHGEPLRALLHVINRQVHLVQADIDRLYENWFIDPGHLHPPRDPARLAV